MKNTLNGFFFYQHMIIHIIPEAFSLWIWFKKKKKGDTAKQPLKGQSA